MRKRIGPERPSAFIDENGGSPGVRLRNRQAKSSKYLICLGRLVASAATGIQNEPNVRRETGKE